MHIRHLSVIRCLVCGGDLAYAGAEQVIENGVLSCVRCRQKYPVIKFVPRILGRHLMITCLGHYYPVVEKCAPLLDYYKTFHGMQHFNGENIQVVEKVETQLKAGYEPPAAASPSRPGAFAALLRKDSAFFKGLKGWDPAVGSGRDLAGALDAVGKDGFLLASDISFAVDGAYERCGQAENLLLVQADLFTEFLKPAIRFDFCHLIDVIPHLTEPRRGVERVFSRLRPGGYFFGTVYAREDVLTRNLISWARFFTRRLPRPTAERLSKALSRKWFNYLIAPVLKFHVEDETRKLLAKCAMTDFFLEQGAFGGTKDISAEPVLSKKEVEI